MTKERPFVLLPMSSINTKAKILHIGVDQLSVSGLAGVTVGQLANASALSKSGLFAHFKSKEQLQIELLSEVARIAELTIVEPAMKADQGLSRLRAVVELWFGWSRRAGLQGGCPLAAALFELDDDVGDVRDHAAQLTVRWRNLLTMLVGESLTAGHLSAATDVAQFIWELNGIYLNHHVSTRFFREKEADARATYAFEALIARHRPESGSAVTAWKERTDG